MPAKQTRQVKNGGKWAKRRGKSVSSNRDFLGKAAIKTMAIVIHTGIQLFSAVDLGTPEYAYALHTLRNAEDMYNRDDGVIDSRGNRISEN